MNDLIEMENKNTVKCGNILITATEIIELDNNKPLVTIPKAQIVNMSVRYGSSANRPFAQAVLSLIAFGFGFIFLYSVLRYLINPMHLDSPSGMAKGGAGAGMLILIGAWLLSEVMRRKYYLNIKTLKSFQKLSFESGAEIWEINQFIRDAGQLGYEIEGIKE